MTKVERTCNRCGLVFASDKLDGLCPGCLLANTLNGDESEDALAFWEDTEVVELRETTRKFSHFDLLEEIGRGGMGVVYRARDLSTERIVAVKVLQSQHLTVPDLVQRFRAEVRAVTSLDHPHVLPIHEVGEYNTVPFFSMKLTTGGSLAHRLGDFLSRPREAAALLAKVARGVHHAHERGILHRDLKPGNILLDSVGEPYVCDFGLAKWLEDDRNLTVTAAVLGTPHYIAPEQASGTKGLTTAVDIYSLGAILYELLTGRPPFVGQSIIETLRQASENTPARPSSLVNNVPRDLETICLKALQREPAARYPTAGAFADDIENWLAGRTINARPVNAAEQLWRWAKRNPLPASLMASVVLVLAISTVVLTLSLRIQRQEVYASRLAQSRASQLTGQARQRFDALDAISQAAKIQPTLELRNEAISALTLMDLRIAAKQTVRESPRKQPLSFSDDLQWVFVATVAGDVEAMTFPGRKRLFLLPGSKQGLQSVSRAGRKFIAGRADNDTFLVWDLATRSLRASFPTASLAGRLDWRTFDYGFSPDESRFAFSAQAEGVSIVDTQDWKSIVTIPTKLQVSALTFSPDGKSVVLSDHTTTALECWEVEPNPLLRWRTTLDSQARSLAWSPHGRTIAAGTQGYSIHLIHSHNGVTAHSLNGHRQDVTQVLFDHSGDLLASTSRDKSIRLWDLHTRSEHVALMGYGSEPTMRFSRDDRHLSGTDFVTDAIVLELSDRDKILEATAPFESPNYATLVSSLDFSPDGSLLATASYRSIDIWNAVGGRHLQSFPIDAKEKTVRFGQDQSVLFIASRASPAAEYSLSLGKTPQLTLVRQLETSAGYIFGSNSAGPASSLSLTSIEHRSVRILPHATEPLLELKNQSEVWDVLVHPKRKWIATSYSTKGEDVTRIWTENPLKMVAELASGTATILFGSPDGDLLITIGNRGCILWDAATWTRGPTLPGEINPMLVNTAAFSPDKQLLALSVGDQIFLLQTGSYRIVAVLESRILSNQKYRIKFSPDSRFLAAQGEDCSVRIWNIRKLQEKLSSLHLAW